MTLGKVLEERQFLVDKSCMSSTNPITGQSQFLITSLPSHPLNFHLSLDDNQEDEKDSSRRLEDSDTRLMQMLAAQSAHREDGSAVGNEEDIAANVKLSDEDKRTML